MAMRVHFWHRHVWDIMVIQEVGNLPFPQLPLCDMLVLCKSLNWMHWSIYQCNRVTEKKWWILGEEEERSVTSRAFSAYGPHLKMVTSSNTW